MKILLAVHHFPPHYTAGAEWRAYRTAAALMARGHAVRVVAVEHIDSGLGGGLTWSDELYDGIPVRRLSFNLAAAPDPFRWAYNNPWIGEHLAQIFKQDRPDVFHLIGGYLISGSALEAAHAAGIPSVLSLTDYWFVCPRISMLRSNGTLSTLPIRPETCARCLGEERRRFRYLGNVLPDVMDIYWQHQGRAIGRVEERLHYLMGVLNQVDAIVSPSQFLRSIYVDMGLDPRRICYSRQGRDFPNQSLDGLKKTPSTTLRVGYAGQIAAHKGLHVLLEALGRLPDAPLSLKIYGDLNPSPAYSQKLRRLAARDPRVELMGVYQRQDLSRVLQDLDVIVVPSLWYENSPNAMLEAFAHFTPVIASDLGGMAELVQPGKNGLLFQPGDADDLARCLRGLIDHPEQIEELRRGIQPVKGVAEEMEELLGIYRQVLPASV